MDISRQQITFKEALSKASDLCSRSEKCSYDIEIKCRDWQLPREEISKLLTYLHKEGFINHERFARSFVHDKFKFNKWGKIKLAYAMRQKQLEEKHIKTALSGIPAEAYQKTLHDLISAKAKTIKEKDPYAYRGKLVAFAQSRGFEPDEAIRMIERLKFLPL
ncbi:MAG: regulatory protein RecX [Prolixibacteraceae bacterium]